MDTIIQPCSPISSHQDADLALSVNDLFSESLLVDFTLYPRTGVRGVRAADVLGKAGFPVADQLNQAIDSEFGTVLRLSANEYWVLNHQSKTDDIQEQIELHKMMGCYSLFCQDSHAWFVLKSSYKAQVLAKLCAVDLRADAFPVGKIAQTVVAGCQSIVVHHQIHQQAVFSILCDRSRAHYLWQMIEDALTEFS